VLSQKEAGPSTSPVVRTSEKVERKPAAGTPCFPEMSQSLHASELFAVPLSVVIKVVRDGTQLGRFVLVFQCEARAVVASFLR
jgi:hypothetical protein